MPDDENDATVTEAVAKEVGKIALSPPATVLNYITIGLVGLFVAVFWLTWQSNQDQPEKLYVLLERSVTQQAESLQVQEKSLSALQEFAVRVPLEHQDQNSKISMMQSDMQKLCNYQEEIRQAILANTQAISKLIESWEKRDVEP